MRHDAMLTQCVDDSLRIADGPKVLNDDGTVGHDEDDGREGTDLVLVDNGSATTCRANSWVLNAIVVDPILASRIGIVRSDFHVVHVVHIAAHDGVGFGNLRSGLLAGAAGGVEEVDEHGLATVEDVKQMDFGAVAVGSREVDGCRERALCFQAKTKGQCENEGKYFFHIRLF